MNAPVATPPPLPVPKPAPPTARVLRRLFLTLFLRGRSARGLQKQGVPTSIGRKLAFTIGLYALMGLLAFSFQGQATFTLAIYLHGMTFVFLGMFVAASAGEVLFNKEEGDILLHRPIEPRALLWAKIGVMVEVSLWLAAAFNLVGFFVGVSCNDGGWLFPIIHAASAFLEALFCTGTVVLVYQLCLRWFGRERLDGLMTLAQVFIAIAAVGAGQIVPRLIGAGHLMIDFNLHTWWIGLLPPAWFAGLDDAVAGSGSGGSWLLGGFAVVITATVLWFAFGKLAHAYEAGLQALSETSVKPSKRRSGRRLADVLVNAPPLCWWLRDPVSRASFLLTVAYLTRDRETKLRVYPGLAPMLVLPIVFLLQDNGHGGGSGWGVAFMGGYLGIIPMLGLNLLHFSQQWQAADVFRSAPVTGPAQLCHGARRAVLVFLTMPLLLLFGVIVWLLRDHTTHLAMVIPGLLALPIYALIPCMTGNAVPLSQPSEEAKSAGRGLRMVGVMVISMVLSGVSMMAWSGGWFRWLLVGETILVLCVYSAMRVMVAKTRWPSME